MTGRQYGPHREADAPNGVVILGRGKWPHPEVHPIPDVLRRQRAAINQLAYHAGHDCSVANCDGTQLGHDLAAEFPAETERVVTELARLAEPDDGLRVNPANLQVDNDG